MTYSPIIKNFAVLGIKIFQLVTVEETLDKLYYIPIVDTITYKSKLMICVGLRINQSKILLNMVLKNRFEVT